MPAFGQLKSTLAKELDEPSEEEINLKKLERLKYLSENESKIISLQAAWKGYKVRKAYNKRLNEFQSNEYLWTKVIFIILLS